MVMAKKKPEPKPEAGPRRTLGEKLKALRDRLGLTQEQAAAKLEISVRTYQNWEQDRAAPDRFVLKHIEATLGKIK